MGFCANTPEVRLADDRRRKTDDVRVTCREGGRDGGVGGGRRRKKLKSIETALMT